MSCFVSHVVNACIGLHRYVGSTSVSASLHVVDIGVFSEKVAFADANVNLLHLSTSIVPAP